MNRQFEIIFCGKQAIDGDTGTVDLKLQKNSVWRKQRMLVTFAVDTAAQKATVTREARKWLRNRRSSITSVSNGYS